MKKENAGQLGRRTKIRLEDPTPEEQGVAVPFDPTNFRGIRLFRTNTYYFDLAGGGTLEVSQRNRKMPHCYMLYGKPYGILLFAWSEGMST